MPITTDSLLRHAAERSLFAPTTLARAITKLGGGFLGGMATDRYAKITSASEATATRDLTDLLAKGLLRVEGDGKSARYAVNVPGWSQSTASKDSSTATITPFENQPMPQDLPPRPEPVITPEMCEACVGIQQHWRRAKGHPELMQGTHRTVAHRHGSVTITKYRCERCGTIWEYENNKVNRHAGWSVLKSK